MDFKSLFSLSKRTDAAQHAPPPVAAFLQKKGGENTVDNDAVIGEIREIGHDLLVNHYAAYFLEVEEGERTAKSHLDILVRKTMDALQTRIRESSPVVSELHRQAVSIVHLIKLEAQRQTQQIHKLAEEILIEERNHMLADHINKKAESLGVETEEGEPYSGIDTRKGSPDQAFAYKLFADSSLNRGAGAGLTETTIETIGKKILTKAQEDVNHFLLVYEEEQKQKQQA